MQTAGVLRSEPRRVSLHSRSFGVEHIWLPSDKSGLANGGGGASGPRTRRDEGAAVAAFLRRFTPPHGDAGRPEPAARPLRHPSRAPISSGYGLQRYYDGVFAEGYFHKGYDYAAGTGWPVVAPASGVIALVGAEADGFEVHGNCVGIDHGGGVASLMLHLDKASVAVGERVEKGQEVGEVGDTGIATGPHLHWGFYVSGESVNPADWLE